MTVNTTATILQAIGNTHLVELRRVVPPDIGYLEETSQAASGLVAR